MEHMKQSTEEVMAAVACEENMFRLPPLPPFKEKPAFALQQHPKRGVAKVFNRMPEKKGSEVKHPRVIKWVSRVHITHHPVH